MKLKLSFLLLLLNGISLLAQETSTQKPTLTTRWAKEVTPQNAWQQYPRPQLERVKWNNLNGLWDYAILSEESTAPAKYDGKILVPFAVESQLSGVQKSVSPDQEVWYRTTFTIPEDWKNQQIILHIGACDWHSTLYINGKKAGEHKGGYDAFKFDITGFLVPGKNELNLKVVDPSDKSWQAVGKQVLKPGGCFYTTVTGIWQTVWLEPVPKTHLESVKYYPDIDHGILTIVPQIASPTSNTRFKAEAFYKGNSVASAIVAASEKIQLKIETPVLWSPDQPELYDLKLFILDGNKTVDEVKSYFGMRKISLGKDGDAYTRMLLNNHFLFQNGPLDQGFWPDGIYTPPSEEAMINDLQLVKNLGFNMLRKHVKVESDRFYYWCDKLGILVWQDMPNGDKMIGPSDRDITRTPESENQFKTELRQLVDNHFNFPSIIMWVPFNEGWGQFKTAETVEFIRQSDPTRLVNGASGWADRGVGDIKDLHTYPEPLTPKAEENRAIVIGEFGGLGYFVENHLWNQSKWGYQTMQKQNELVETYASYYKTIYSDVKYKGLSAVIYTQITDVETECNGLLTYDREVSKIDAKTAYGINKNLFLDSPVIDPGEGLINKNDKITITAPPGLEIRYTLDGSEPGRQSLLYTVPLSFEENQEIRAKTFNESGESLTVKATLIGTDRTKPIYSQPFSRKYSAGGYYALCDGISGSKEYTDGKWQGFSGVSPEIMFTLPSSCYVSEISMQVLDNQRSWIFFPRKVSVLVSVDGEKWKQLPDVNFTIEKREYEMDVKEIKFPCNTPDIRFVKAKFDATGNCPDWHPGMGNPAWIFVDEIKIRN